MSGHVAPVISAGDAASFLRDRLDIRDTPVAAIVLGSGLGGLADRLENARRIPFAEIPGFPAATVEGHAGALLAGRLENRPVIALAGRFHLYEGHGANRAAFPVRVTHALGARTLVVSNAAGGVRRTFRVGDLMLIRDHINMMWRNPLIGAVQSNETRFPDMSAPYDPELTDLLRQCAAEHGIAVQEGVYLALLGPTYETPAEVRMLERLGADAVGMSTVPEVLAARALGMRVAGISCITNMACGISLTPLDHAEVIEVTTRVGERFQRLVSALIARL